MTTTHPADLSDDELAAQAVAADPEPDLRDALPFAQVVGGGTDDDALPTWYMPAPMLGARVLGWRRGIVFTFIFALLVIEAFGLCTTFGPGF
jgi:hypothetical protein